MTRMRYFLLIFFFHLVYTTAQGQDNQLIETITSLAEELVDDEDNPDAVSEYIEKLHELNETPVKINSADETELSRLFFLTDFQIKTLNDYIHSSGRVYSVYEIANVPGFNKDLVLMIIPFISLGSDKKDHSDSIRIRNNFLTNFSVRFPETDTTSNGSPWKLLTRYKFYAGGFSGVVTAEKDSGEKLFTDKFPFMDFLSAGLSWEGKGILQKIIIGDFGTSFGLGTSLNTGLRTGLSLTQSGYLSGNDEIRQYSSTDENMFFRGAAARFRVNRFGVSLFYSINRIDASLDSSNTGTDQYIDTFYRSGLHNSLSSIKKKDSVREDCFGLNFTANFKNIRTGLIWSGNRFSIPVSRNSNSDPERINDFEGDRNYIASIYYKASLSRSILFGEFSSNLNGKLAIVQGISLRPADRLTLNIIYRNYNPGFTAFHGKGLFTSSSGDNINGLFANFNFEAARHFFLSAGCDLRYFPWIKYRCSAPSLAVSREIRLKYLKSDKITFETLFKYQRSVMDIQETTGIEKQENLISRSLKCVFRYYPEDNLTLVTRLDYKIVNPDRTRGMLIYQDINYRLRIIPVTIWFRYCIFKTDSWDSRLYTYENDLVYNFSIPALSGEGSRCYIMLSWRPVSNFDLRIKCAFRDLINNRDDFAEIRELKIQLRMWF